MRLNATHMSAFLKKPIIISVFCFLSGSVSAFAMAPYNIWVIFFIGFGVLYWSIHSAARKRSAFAFGWLWAFGYFLFSLYWIGNALLVEGNPYQWAYPLAVSGLPALLACFNGVACVFIKRFLKLETWQGYLGAVAALSLAEWLRGYLFTGFPWNLYGYTWIDLLPIAQLVSLESVYFLTFVTLFWMTIGGYWTIGKGKLSKRVLNVVILASFFGVFSFGEERLNQDISLDDNTLIKIVQPNTPQDEKWQRDKMEGHFRDALGLSRAHGGEPKETIIIWPETTLSPYFLEKRRDDIAKVLKGYKNDVILLSGALQHDRENSAYYNSLLTIDKNGAIGNTYNKSHLVPFGEYIPFQDIIPLKTITQFQGFEKGNGPANMSVFNDTTYSPLICYEILFPHKATADQTHPDLIVNITNDAWYGDSAGPRQHLAKAQFRAIEEGIPVLRAANTGISAIINYNGKTLGETETFTHIVLEQSRPLKASKFIKNQYVRLFLFPLTPLILLVFSIANTYQCMFKRSRIR